MEDVVVKVLSIKHGKKVIQAFKDLGVDTFAFKGSSVSYYYGLIKGDFYAYAFHQNSKVITLEDLKAMKKEAKPKYPCMMEVWDDERDVKQEREVIAEFINNSGETIFAALYVNRDGCTWWSHARPIQPDPLKEVVAVIKQQTNRIEKVKNTEESGLIANSGVFLTTEEAQLIIDALDKNEK